MSLSNPKADTLQPAPESPLDPATGELRFGVYGAEFPTMNLDQAWIRWRGIKIPPPLSRLRLKQWQHFGLVLPDLFVGLAVVDAGFLRTSWCHVVDRRAAPAPAFEHRRSGMGLDLKVARDLWDGVTRVREKGYQVEVHNRLGQGEHHLKLAIDERQDRPQVGGSVRCLHDLSAIQPLVVLLPVGPGRAMYSHKVPLPLEGTLLVDGRRVEARPDESFAILDIHKAHYPRHTWWRWATFAWRDGANRALGLNLTHNVAGDQPDLNENALWLEGRVQRLGSVRFEFDRQQVLEPWQLGTSCQSVDLRFTPQGERCENLRLGVARSVFHQLHGTFSGTVRFDGETIVVDRAFGLCEDHDSLW